MTNTRKLTEGAVLLAVFSVLLIGVLYLPILWVLFVFFLPLPFIVFTVKYGFKSSLLFFVASLFTSFIIGTIMTLPIAFTYGTLGIVIGYAIREKKGRFFLYINSTLVLSVTLLIQYVLSILILGINVIEKTFDATQSTMLKATEILEGFGQKRPVGFDVNSINQMFDLVRILFPVLLVVSSFVAMYLILLACSPILKRLRMPLPKRIPFKDWSFPKSIIWYFLLVTIVSFFVPAQSGSFLYAAIMNLTFMIHILLMIQGLSFVYYFAYNKGIAKAVPVIITISIFLIPIGLLLIVLLGIIDIGFDLRQRVNQSIK